MKGWILTLMFLALGVYHIASQTIVDSKRRDVLLAKSDSLFAVGVDLYNAEKYEEAIPVFTESDKIDKAVLDSTSNRRDYSAMWLASCYYQSGDSVKANETHKYYNYPPVDRRLTVKSDSLGTLAWDTWRNEDLPTAVQYAIQCAEIEKGIVGDQHVWYGNTATIIAKFYCAMGKYEAAAEYERIAQDIIGQTYWESLVHFASSLHSQASQLCDYGYYTRAVCLEEQALAVAKHLLGKEHADEFIEIGKTGKILVEATRKALFEQKKLQVNDTLIT